MNRKQFLSVLVAFSLIAIFAVSVAWADPPSDNPNVEMLSNVVCDNGVTFDAVYVPGPGTAGLDPDSTVVGIAKSLYLISETGNRVLIWERGAQGNPSTVWCEWGSLEARFGGDIHFAAVH